MEAFQKLMENNKDKNWNDPVFRQTMVNAFGYTVNRKVEELRERMNKTKFTDTERLFFEAIEMVAMTKEGFSRLLNKIFGD